MAHTTHPDSLDVSPSERLEAMTAGMSPVPMPPIKVSNPDRIVFKGAHAPTYTDEWESSDKKYRMYLVHYVLGGSSVELFERCGEANEYVLVHSVPVLGDESKHSGGSTSGWSRIEREEIDLHTTMSPSPQCEAVPWSELAKLANKALKRRRFIDTCLTNFEKVQECLLK